MSATLRPSLDITPLILRTEGLEEVGIVVLTKVEAEGGNCVNVLFGKPNGVVVNFAETGDEEEALIIKLGCIPQRNSGYLICIRHKTNRITIIEKINISQEGF